MTKILTIIFAPILAGMAFIGKPITDFILGD